MSPYYKKNYNRTEPAADVLRRIVSWRRFSGRLGHLMLGKTWRDAVGDLVADHTRPLRLSKGRLTLAVESNAWMNELLFYVPMIIERLNEALGEGKVSDIRMKIANWKSADQPIFADPPLPDLDEEEKNIVSELTVQVRDEQLRESLSAACRRSMQLKKYDREE